MRLFFLFILVFFCTKICFSIGKHGDSENTIYVFYLHTCPHCHEAMQFLKEIETEYPDIKYKYYEVSEDKMKQELFELMAEKYGVQGYSVPLILFCDDYLQGFDRKAHEEFIRTEIKKCLGRSNNTEIGDNIINVPLFGKVNIYSASLPFFSITIGLLDGLNPCAMWVLMFLLSLLVYARSRKRILQIGGIFIIASGVIYFIFMAAWFNFFAVISYQSAVTLILGIVAIVMGIINIKDLFWFKAGGVSLMIPESAKPKLFKKMRALVNEKSFSLLILSTITLAIFVNFIELACTVGLPAIFSKILVVQKVSLFQKYMYMVVYNIAYVVPLATIVGVFAITLGNYKLNENQARILKGISGILMLVLGIVLVLKPEILQVL